MRYTRIDSVVQTSMPSASHTEPRSAFPDAATISRWKATPCRTCAAASPAVEAACNAATWRSSAASRSSSLLASGTAVRWALEARRLLAEDWDVRAQVWSVTSWTELRREALAGGEGQVPYITRALADATGPVVAVSDWMRAVPDQIAPWARQEWTSLGTDGFGLSDTRAATRAHFAVDAPSIVIRTLRMLARRGRVKPEAPEEAMRRYGRSSG